MNISEKKRFIILIGFIAIVLLPFVSAQYFGFFDFYSLSDMYKQYYQWFDLAIYYMIFGSLARLVFEKRFGENEHAVTALYNGVAIFMSLGLVLYESTQLNNGEGGALLLVGGRWIFLVALLIAGVGLYSILRGLTGWGVLRCALISALAIWLLAYGLRDVSGVSFSEAFNNALEWLFILIFGILLILGTIWAVRGRGGYAPNQGRIPGGFDQRGLEPLVREINNLRVRLDETRKEMLKVDKQVTETKEPEEKRRLAAVKENLFGTIKMLSNDLNNLQGKYNKAIGTVKQKYGEWKEKRSQEDIQQGQQVRQAVVGALGYADNFSRDRGKLEENLATNRKDDLIKYLVMADRAMAAYKPTKKFSRRLSRQIRTIGVLCNRFDKVLEGPMRDTVVEEIEKRIKSGRRSVLKILYQASSKFPS